MKFSGSWSSLNISLASFPNLHDPLSVSVWLFSTRKGPLSGSSRIQHDFPSGSTQSQCGSPSASNLAALLLPVTQSEPPFYPLLALSGSVLALRDRKRFLEESLPPLPFTLRGKNRRGGKGRRSNREINTWRCRWILTGTIDNSR